MAAGMFSTGPCDLFMAPAGGGPAFLGNCARTLQVDFDVLLSEHFNDVAGIMLPYDRSYQGKRIVCSGVLTLADVTVLQTFMQTQNPGAAGAPDPLTDQPGDRGTLIMTENVASTLWVRFNFAVKFANVGLISGFRFINAVISRQVWRDLQPGATSLPFTFTCGYFFIPGVSNQFGAGAWSAGDFDMTALPANPYV